MIVRFATASDAQGLCEIYAPYVERTAISFEIDPPSPTEMVRRVAETLPRHPWLVAADGETLLGYAYAHPFADRAAYRWSVETSVYVAAAAHRQGVGRALYATLLGRVAEQGYRQAFAGIALPNPASVALHETLGFGQVATFTRVGWKFGAWHDVGWWQRGLGPDGDGDPREPGPPATGSWS